MIYKIHQISMNIYQLHDISTLAIARCRAPMGRLALRADGQNGNALLIDPHAIQGEATHEGGEARSEA
jgi:hypothetical protein